MMLSKRCTQYANKFGKLSSRHRIGKSQFPLQHERRAMPKNAQTELKSLSCVWLFATPRTIAYRISQAGVLERVAISFCKESSNYCTTVLISHMASSSTKPPKPGFDRTWTENLQVSKLVLEKAGEPEIKLPTSAGSLKKQENSRKHLLHQLC